MANAIVNGVELIFTVQACVRACNVRISIIYKHGKDLIKKTQFNGMWKRDSIFRLALAMTFTFPTMFTNAKTQHVFFLPLAHLFVQSG